LGGAAAAEGQGAVNALDVNGSSFGRVRSRPAKIIKGAKKAAYYPKALFPSRSLALTAGRRSTSCRLLRRTARSSRLRNRPKPTPLAPRPKLLALVRVTFMQCRV
jgi:ribosomal protein L13